MIFILKQPSMALPCHKYSITFIILQDLTPIKEKYLPYTIKYGIKKLKMDTQKLAHDIHCIDIEMYGLPQVSSVYILSDEGRKITIVETGTPSSADKILEGIEALGFQKEDVTNIIVTQVHLDHAGGAGILVKKMPWIEVFVHERGARHLVDPSFLQEKTKEVMMDLFSFFGDAEPIPERNIKPIKDYVLEMKDGKRLRIFSTPGHASHHMCIYEEKNKFLFCGEALGTYYPAFNLLMPAVTPGFDLNASLDSIDRMKEMNIRCLLFSHFGPSWETEKIIDESLSKLNFYADLIKEKMEQGKEPNVIIEEVRADYNFLKKVYSEAFMKFCFSALVNGYLEYFEKKGGIKK